MSEAGSESSASLGLGQESAPSSFAPSQSESQQPTAELSEHRQAIASLYNMIKGLQGGMEGVNTLQQRLSPLLNPPQAEGPRFDDYDAELESQKKEIAALANIVKGYIEAQYQQQTEQQRIAQERYTQELGNWVQETQSTIDSHLEEHGYPGFSDNAASVREYIRAELHQASQSYAPNSVEMAVCKHLSESPQYWADVYTQHIVPKLTNHMTRFSRMADARDRAVNYNPQNVAYSGRPQLV